MSIKKDILWRIYAAFFAFSIVGVAVIGKALKIQTVEGEHWRALADSTYTAYMPIDAERGNIISEDGRLLATSLPFFEVRFDVNADALTDKIFNQHIDELAGEMSAFFGDKSKASYKQYLIKARNSRQRYLLIRKNVTYPELQEIKTWPLFNLGRYKGGLIAIQHNKRVMPFKMLAHRTIGYVRADIQPVGLEGQFDEPLAGVRGKRLMQKISGGTWIPVNDEDEIRSENGNDIVTTIDVNLQDVVESSLLKAIQRHNADHGTCIVMEVETGKIKAIANIGKTNNDEYWEDYNYAVGEATEPGSTFKLASLLALLEDGYINVNDSIDIELGKHEFYDRVMKDSEKHDLRNVTIKHAFEVSSNVAFAKLIDQHYQHQPDKFTDHLKDFNLYEKTGVEIKGEASPYIKTSDDKHWSGVTLPWMAVGYELTLTPLQTLALYNTIANDGYPVKPYLVSEIQKNGKTVKKFKPEVSNDRICSGSTLSDALALLKGVAENGTASHMYTKNYEIAGKTGTAQIARNNRYGKEYQASFAGFFPADDPKYSCIVVINSPKNGVYYGGWVAGPVFREVADKIYARSLDMHQPENEYKTFVAERIPYLKVGNKNDAKTIYDDLGVNCDGNTDGQWVTYERQGNKMKMLEKKQVDNLVPNVKGMGLRDAVYLLENAGLRVSVKGVGRVRQQSISPGSRVNKGSKIELQLS